VARSSTHARVGSAAGLLLAFLATSCSRSGRPPAIPESAKVLHLTSSAPLEYRAADDVTRPSVSIPPGQDSEWPIPPGPARLLRTAVVGESGNGAGPTGTIGAYLETSEPSAASRNLASLEVAPKDSAAWKDWKFEVPAVSAARRIVFRWRPRGPNPGPLTLAQPTLSKPSGKSPVIFVLFDIDTLRKDHLSIYGYERKTTPNIDRFFGKGMVWENAFSNATWTLPSHVSMFTSTLPNEHGVEQRVSAIPPDVPILAEALQRAGYRTLAVTNGGLVDPSWGFGRGFDSYGTKAQTSEREVDDFANRLAQYEGEPIFLFFHTYQVHGYIPPVADARSFFGSTDPLGPSWRQNFYITLRYLTDEYGFPKVREWLINRYDAALFGVDRAFERALGVIDKAGLEDRTSILLTSDHGEEIFDRPYKSPDPFAHFGHVHPYLYDEYLRVPLLLKVPWQRPRQGRSRDYVSLLDLAPTILDILQVPLPNGFRGTSLLAAGRTARRLESRLVASQAVGFDAFSIRLGPHVLIRRTDAPLESPWAFFEVGRLPPFECFDETTDPGDRHPLPCSSPWAEPLKEASFKYLAGLFPGSLVLRVSRKHGETALMECEVEVRERSGFAAVSGFGVDAKARFWNTREATRGKFSVGEAPVWIAFTPNAPMDAMSVRVYVPDSVELRSPAQIGRTGEIHAWSDLAWHPPPPLPGSVTVFTTPPGHTPVVHRTPAEVMGRLRALGYLAGGEDEPASRRLEPSTRPSGPVAWTGPSPGQILIQKRIGLPAWNPPADLPGRTIDRLDPPEVTRNTPFHVGPKGRSQLDVFGKHFSSNDVVFFELEPIPTQFVDSTHLRAEVPPSFLTMPAEISVIVSNPIQRTARPGRATFRVLSRDAPPSR
jgi:arylsulfatase A-like enzyme